MFDAVTCGRAHCSSRRPRLLLCQCCPSTASSCSLLQRCLAYNDNPLWKAPRLSHGGAVQRHTYHSRARTITRVTQNMHNVLDFHPSSESPHRSSSEVIRELTFVMLLVICQLTRLQLGHRLFGYCITYTPQAR